jgi:hypothetical protein
MRKLSALVAAFGALVILAMPASAAGAGAVSMTQTFHNATQTMPVPNPCTGAPGSVDLTYNGVAHVTFLTSGVGASTGWGTFTATGNFTFTPIDPSQPTFAGHFTNWDGFNFNLNNFTSTGTFIIHGTGSDGSVLTFHDVAHITVLNPLSPTPTVVVNFDKPTCG